MPITEKKITPKQTLNPTEEKLLARVDEYSQLGCYSELFQSDRLDRVKDS